MHCLIDFCCICFNKENLQPLSGCGSDNLTYFLKLIFCVPEMCFNDVNNKRFICKKCCKTLDAAYKFRQRCLKSKTTLTNYISQLHQISNISGIASVYLTDLNKFVDIKKENNIEKTEIFINMNENTTDENFVINPTTEITGNNYIQLGNIIIKMEEENQNSDEDVEETLDNSLVNHHDTKIDVSQNDNKLIAHAKNRGNENQDFKEHLHERFDNILEIFDSENDKMAAKIEENNYNSLYSENCFDDPSAILDEIKIDIVDNDIKPMNSEINIQCKSENNEGFSTENNDLSSEDEDKTDKEMKFFHKILKVKQKKTSLSKNITQKKCDVGNRKAKIVKKHECSICTKKFTQSSSLNLHMRIHTGEKLHECDVCQKKFTWSTSLMLHKRIHNGEKPYACDICQKKFSQSISLTTHKRIHTGEKPHKCDVCQEKFTQLSHLIRHKRIHTGEKPHACDVCQNKFTDSSNLISHKRIHTGEKPHACDVCQKNFIQSSDLKRHMRIHTGEKCECDVCQKKFSLSSSLRMHKRIHTGEKLHKCDVCQKKFIQLGNLKQHKIIHSGEKPHACDVCQKKFGHLHSMKRHLKMHTAHETA